MRKLLLVMVIVLTVTSVFALGEQKIYSVDAEEYQMLSDVYLSVGYAMPSSTGPWSATELRMMFNKINPSDVPSFMTYTYQELKNLLFAKMDVEDGGFGATAKGAVNVFLYGHNNTLFQGHDAFMADTRIPTADFNLDFAFGENVHFHFNPALQNSEISKTEVGATNFFSNIMLLQNLPGGGDFDMSMPNRAYAAFGGKNIFFQIGRDKLNWGLGKTGNVTISKNIPRHDMARFTVFAKRFKFTYLISTFPHKENYYTDLNGTGKYNNAIWDTGLVGTSMYIGHRLEGRFFKDKLSLTVTEAMMFASKDSYLNLSTFNPAMLFHNIYMAGNSNSTLAFEADVTPFKNFNVYGQFLIDDYAGPGEDKTTANSKGSPNAFGLVFGVSYLAPAFKGTIKLNGEFAKIDPYTYLRYSKNSSSNGSDEAYGLDYIVAMRFYQMANNTPMYEEFVLGYPYGPDCLVGNLNATFTSKDRKLNLAANAFFMAHGTHDKWTSWMRTGNCEGWQEDYYAPTTSHLTTNRNDSNAQSRNAVEYTFDFGLAAQYKLSKHFKFRGQADIVYVWNYGNIKTSEIVKDYQLSVGATFSY